MSVLMFFSVQYIGDTTIRGGHHEFSEDFILIDSNFTQFWKFPGKNVKQNYK